MKKQEQYKPIIKIISVSFISLVCFVLGAFVGKYFSQKQDQIELKNDYTESSNDNEDGSNYKRNVASTEESQKVVIVGKKRDGGSFINTNRGIASVANSDMDNPSDYIMLGKYTIVVAEYNLRDRAILHVEELKNRGLIESFYVNISDVDRQTYRVNIGLYDTKQEALDRKESLSEIVDLSNAVVKVND